MVAGLCLEAALGLRVAGLLDDPIAREFLRLGHAHGGVLGLLNLGVAWSLERLRTPDAWARPIRSTALCGAFTVGFGFVGGGLWHGPTDPGPLVLLVPAGALAVLGAVVATAWIRPHSDANTSA